MKPVNLRYRRCIKLFYDPEPEQVTTLKVIVTSKNANVWLRDGEAQWGEGDGGSDPGRFRPYCGHPYTGILTRTKSQKGRNLEQTLALSGRSHLPWLVGLIEKDGGRGVVERRTHKESKKDWGGVGRQTEMYFHSNNNIYFLHIKVILIMIIMMVISLPTSPHYYTHQSQPQKTNASLSKF